VAFARAVVRVEGEEVSGWSEIALLDLTSSEIRSLAIEVRPDVRDPACRRTARGSRSTAWAKDDGGRCGAPATVACDAARARGSARCPAFADGARLPPRARLDRAYPGLGSGVAGARAG
jgi:hypothetical protein